MNGWEELGCCVGKEAPAVSAWGPGRLDLFSISASGLLHSWYNDGEGWVNGWEPLGGSLIRYLAAVSWGYGHIDVFGESLDSPRLQHLAYDEASGGWQAWEP